jgi:hypothetical protein
MVAAAWGRAPASVGDSGRVSRRQDGLEAGIHDHELRPRAGQKFWQTLEIE